MRKGGIYFLRAADGTSHFMMAVGPVGTDLELWHGIQVDITIQPETIAIFDPASAEEIGFEEPPEERDAIGGLMLEFEPKDKS